MTTLLKEEKERGQISGSDIRDFIMAGNAKVTFVNTETGNRFTYKVSAPMDREKMLGILNPQHVLFPCLLGQITGTTIAILAVFLTLRILPKLPKATTLVQLALRHLLGFGNTVMTCPNILRFGMRGNADVVAVL